MSWLFPSVVAATASAALVLVVYALLWSEERTKFLRLWTISWGFYLLRFVFALMRVRGFDHPIGLFLHDGAALAAGLFLLWGTYDLLDRRMPWFWVLLAGLAVGWTALAFGGGFGFEAATVGTYTILGAIYLGTGVVLLRHGPSWAWGRKVLGGAFILWGIHKADYPFLLPVEWFAPWGFLLAALLGMLVALGMILFYLQYHRHALIETQRTLAASEHGLRSTLDALSEGVIAVDAEGRILQLNRVARELTGVGDVANSSTHVSEAFGRWRTDEEDDAGTLIRELLHDCEAGSGGQDVTLRAARDGHRLVAVSASPVASTRGSYRGAVLVLRDVTLARRLEDQLRQSHRMEAIGQLAGGVAHDFNNLLTGIIGNAQLVALETEPDSELAEHADAIIRTAERAADLTKQLLAFARKGRLQTIDVDTHAVVGEVGRLLSRSIDKRIEIVTNLAADKSVIAGDPSQIENAVLNLAVNARDAMPDGGKLTLQTRNLRIDEGVPRWGDVAVAPGEYLELTVADTGAGMDPDTRQRIFEPFFTTKRDGQGTGLGLAGVYGCMESHGGHISVQSEVGEGSAFRLLFRGPTAAEATTSDRPERAEPQLPRGTGHVLVIDDEDVVRVFAAKALRALGYTVTVAADGAAGIAEFTARPEQFGLVLLDVVMPNKGAVEVLPELLAADPDVPVLLASGFTHTKTIDGLLAAGARALLVKPFDFEELASEVAHHIRAEE